MFHYWILGAKFEEEFDVNEKAKLYQAIGYKQDDVPTTLPKEVSP